MDHPTYPRWITDGSEIEDPEGRGEHVVQFFKRLRHPNSEHPDLLAGLPWFWERILRKIYGPVDEDGERLVRSVFIMIGRGARKTSIAGGLALYHTSARGIRRPNGQVLVGAASKMQGFLVFKEAKRMALATPGFVSEGRGGSGGNDVVLIRGNGEQAAEDPYIQHIDDKTILKVQSADGDLSHGTTPSVVIYDELHTFKSRKLWSALQTGLSKVKKPTPLQIVITTAGRGQEGLAWERYQYARKVASGEIIAPHFLPVLFEPPSPDADWRDPNLWELTNPGISEGFPDAKGLAIEADDAIGSPAAIDDFKQYHLNFWLQQSLSPFVDMSVYDEGDIPVDLDAHEKFHDPCWVGVDLGWNDDLCAVAVAWPDRSGRETGYDVWVYVFCPEAKIQKRGNDNSAKYKEWSESSEQFMVATPGDATDYTTVREKIEEICSRFNVQEVAFDPKFASEMMASLMEKGINAVAMQQGWITMAPAIKEFHRAVISRRLSHGGHPVLRWNIENVVVHKDSAGNQTFHKGKSTDKIDAAQAVAMAVGRAHANGSPEVKPIPFYLQPGFDVDDALGIDEKASEAERSAEDIALDEKIRAMLEDD